MPGNKPDCSAPGQFEWQPSNFECGKLPPEKVIPFVPFPFDVAWPTTPNVTMPAQTRADPFEKGLPYVCARFFSSASFHAFIARRMSHRGQEISRTNPLNNRPEGLESLFAKTWAEHREVFSLFVTVDFDFDFENRYSVTV